MESSQKIIEAVKASASQKIKLAITDVDGILRGKVISKEKFLKALDQNFGFCNVVFGWDANDAVYNNSKVMPLPPSIFQRFALSPGMGIPHSSLPTSTRMKIYQLFVHALC